jgi:N-acetyl-gamma-glutamylphosphate reductase
MFNFEPDVDVLEAFVEGTGWSFGVTSFFENQDLASVVACTAMALIRTPDKLEDIDELYEESFGRSFFIRRDEESDWTPDIVADKPWAAYRLRITPDAASSLLTIQVMADRNGKCGAAQVVHAMNLMAGFEESLGIA